MFSQLYFHQRLKNYLHPLVISIAPLLIIAVTVSSMSSSAPPSESLVAKPGCQAKCGKVFIPYPFGIGDESCAIHPAHGTGFRINCSTFTDPSVPFIVIGKNEYAMEVLSISSTEIIITTKVAVLCYDESGRQILSTKNRNDSSLDLGDSVFTFSHIKNKFYVVGCNSYGSTKKVLEPQRHTLELNRCNSYCENRDDVKKGPCTEHNGCCEENIPKGLKNLMVDVNSFGNRAHFSPCSYAYLSRTDDDYTFDATDILNIDNPTNNMELGAPVVLDWAIGNKTCAQAKKDLATYACKKNTNCDEALNPGYRCTCMEGYEGNPYLSPGCGDLNECLTNTTNDCILFIYCENTWGSYSCVCPEGSYGDGKKSGSGCTKKDVFPRLKVAVGIGLGVFLFIVVSCVLYLSVRTRKLAKLKEKFFQQNGGLLLRQQMSSGEIGVDSTKLFTDDELRLATNNYDDKNILGRGGNGTVYKGTFPDNRIVAIKKSILSDDKSQVQQFINEVIILSQINHRNVVKLLGCCLETEVPLLVYEYVSSGTLSEHIHQNCGVSSMSWDSRLRIAVETSNAIAYLHSAASTPIIHRDIKTTNILLDENYTAKVSDFGASKLIPLDQTRLNTMVQGTLGYLDPEYFHTGQLTEKSDVYSFGVVLLELLTGEKPVSLDKPEEQRSLATYFISCMKANRHFELLEEGVAKEGKPEQLLAVSQLAVRCLNLTGEGRPSMKQVAVDLESLRIVEAHAWSHENITEHFSSEPAEDLYSLQLDSSSSTTYIDAYTHSLEINENTR